MCVLDPTADSLWDVFQSVGEDIQVIMDKLNTIQTRLNGQILLLCSEQPSDVDTDAQEMTRSQTPSPPEPPLNFRDPFMFDAGDDGTNLRQPDMNTPPHTDQILHLEQPQVKGQHGDCGSLEKKAEVEGNGMDTSKANLNWITLG